MLVLVAVDLTLSSFLVVDVFFTAFESVFFVETDFFVICFSSDDFDVTADLFQAAKMLIDNIDFKTNFDRSEAFAKQFIPVAVEFAFLGMGFASTEEAVEYLALEE